MRINMNNQPDLSLGVTNQCRSINGWTRVRLMACQI